jgi:hypothetical protein
MFEAGGIAGVGCEEGRLFFRADLHRFGAPGAKAAAV